MDIRRVVSLLLLVAVAACSNPVERPIVTRLVDEFDSATLAGTPASRAPDEPIEWRFDDADNPQWTAALGVDSGRVRDARFVGRTTATLPILHVERTTGLDDPDILHEVVVRARVSAGSEMRMSFSGSDEVNFERLAERAAEFPWQLSTPLVPGEDAQSYTINVAGQRSITASGTRHVLLQPTDVADADFEIESVRLVFRKEHLSTISAGVGWQGLSESYRESIVTRAPERARFTVSLPADPVLDLALGTVEELPVTFRIEVGDDVVLRRTLTTPHRWEEVTIDLGHLANQDVAVTLALEGREEGAIGFWGAPAIRSRGATAAGAVEDRPGFHPPRGVVLVLFDTLRKDHLNAYGYERETAPNVARLAADGVMFSDAIAQGAWTKVSVPSILSSTYPTSNGIYELAHKLPAAADTLAESFRAAGYATWGATANGFSGRASNLHQGMEVFHEPGSLVVPEGQHRSKSARALVDRLLPWLDSHADAPFFVFLHTTDPHSPYQPYRPYDTFWGEADAKQRHDEEMEKIRPIIDREERTGGLPHREDLIEAGVDPEAYDRRELDWYDGATRAADAEIERLMEKLEALGIADDTLVVFFSDHGEEFRDHGGGFHEENVYGELLNVPLVFRWPAAIPAGQVVDQTVEMLNLAPTVLDLVGLATPERMTGESLAPLLSLDGLEHSWRARPAVSEWRRRTDQLDAPFGDAYSIIVDDWKLIRNVNHPGDAAEHELYSHAADPLDQQDVAGDNPEVVERLSGELDKWLAWAESLELPTDAEATEGLDAAELERLRSLGYIQ